MGCAHVVLHAAVLERDDPIAAGGDVGLVGDDEHRAAMLAVEVHQQLQDLLGRTTVEVAGGLVGEDQLGLVHEGPGDGDPLALTTRELRRPVVQALAEPHELQSLLGPLEPLGP